MSSTTLSLTPSDLLAAWRLQRRHNLFVKVCMFSPAVLAALYLLTNGRDLLDYGWRVVVWDPVLPLLIVFLVIVQVLGAKVTLPNRAKRLLQQQKGMGGEIAFAWDAEGLRITGATGYNRLAWSDFVQWLEDDVSLVMFQSDNLLNPLPKRCLTEEQIAEIRGYLTAALGKAGKKRK
jgi:hypothetical protein